MHKIKPLLTLLVVLFSSAAPGRGGAEILRLPLRKLTPTGQVDLRCVSASHDISVPVPERWKVERATLSFGYANSTALLGNSRLVTKLNGSPISQTGLSPLAPERFLKVSLPARRFKPGYNDLEFSVQQHYSSSCEFPCQPELWTTLKLGDDEAVLELEYEPRAVPLKLSALSNFLFDPKLNPDDVNIVMPDLGADTIGAASIIASGVAQKFDYRSVGFTVSREIAPGRDNVLIGDKAFVSKVVPRGELDPEDIQGPFLKILPLPRGDGRDGRGRRVRGGEDPYHALIVVSGLNKEHVKLAAETFAVMSAPFPETDAMTVTGLVMPDIPLYGGRGVIKADATYTFKALNFPSHTFVGGNANGAEIRFRLPADFLIKQNRYAELSLHYSYGAANRADSVLNVSVNGKLFRGINLDDARGALIEGYKLDIPTYLFKPGDNVLRFEPVLAPLVGKNCEYFQTQNLFLTIMDASTLKFPPMPHYVDMPRLELFMLNGFPVTRWPDGHGAEIFLPGADRSTVEAALNLVGLITQKNGHPLLDVKYALSKPEAFDGELIVVGDTGSLPDTLKAQAPLALTKETAFPYPVVQGWAGESQFAFSRQISGLSPGRGALMQFQSPYFGRHSVVMLTARTAKEVRETSRALMEPGVQANIRGSVALLDLSDPENNIITADIGKRYFAGKAGPISRLDAYLYRYPVLYSLLLGAVIVGLGLIVFYFLVKHRKRRIKGA